MHTNKKTLRMLDQMIKKSYIISFQYFLTIKSELKPPFNILRGRIAQEEVKKWLQNWLHLSDDL